MKKLLICSLMSISITSMTAFAQDANQLKEMSLKACETQAAQVPEAQRDSILSVCKCTVENTDYKAMMSGDASAQTKAMEVAQKCAKENS